MSADRDPERHGFELRPATDRDLISTSRGGHVLDVTSPTYGDDRCVSTNRLNFSLAELADLHDLLGAYLDDHRR